MTVMLGGCNIFLALCTPVQTFSCGCEGLTDVMAWCHFRSQAIAPIEACTFLIGQ